MDRLICGDVGFGKTEIAIRAAFKVVTESGVVYLMGRVTQREADHATEITRQTGGVQKVVRVFEIISEDELRNLLPQPAATPAPAKP